VVGGGMVPHRLVEALSDRDQSQQWCIEVFAEESRPPCDRVALTSFFSGRDPEDLLLGEPELWRREGVRLHTNAQVNRSTPGAAWCMPAAAPSPTTRW
jgi:nitrite reductase (NADH) large subunit